MSDHSHDHHGDDHHGEHHVHVTPLMPMVLTFIALLILTGLTVATAKGLYFGNAANLIIALVIASAKGILVAAFFMHLVWDKAMNTIVVVSTMFATTLFLVLTLVDLGTRDMVTDIEEGEIVAGGAVTINVDEEGGRSVSRGVYNPWFSDAPGESVLAQARADYKAKKHDGDHGYGDDKDHSEDHGDDHAEGEDHSGDEDATEEAEGS
jgi:cytochrome c oxidase subunit 4